MTHQRTDIRLALVALLLASPQTAAQGRVYPNRVIPLTARGMYPAIVVYTLSEQPEEHSSSPRILDRTMDVGITIIESATDQDPVDDLVDLIAAQVEAKLNVDRTLGGLCQDVIYAGFDAAFDHKGLELTGGGRLRYRVIYQTEEPEGELDPAPFEVLNTKVNFPPADAVVESEETQDIEQ